MATPLSSRMTMKTPSGSTNIEPSRVGPMSPRPSRPRSSACCAPASACTSAESKGSAPERIEARVERDRSHFLPATVLTADDERLIDVELDPVPAPHRAVDRDRPLVVGEDRMQPAAIRATGLYPRPPQEFDHRARAAVLAAHHRIAGNTPDDVAGERGTDHLRVAAE